MNKFLIAVLFISNFGFGQDIKYFSEDFEFVTGDIAYLFGDDVKLRDQPGTTSHVISLLKIGDQIEIVSKTDETMFFEGLESPWYQVKFQDKTGYILGGLISLDKQNHHNLTYLITLKKDDSELFLKTRVIGHGNSYLENSALLSTHYVSTEAHGNRGLEGVDSIFAINYLSEACGVNGGGIYLFHNGNQLLKAIDYTQVSDAGVYWFYEEYIFPTDEGGRPGKIIYKKETGETIDDETEWVETKKTERLLEWSNDQLIPKIEIEEN